MIGLISVKVETLAAEEEEQLPEVDAICTVRSFWCVDCEQIVSDEHAVIEQQTVLEL
ncbi:MAG TPA: hypothetical protein VNB49_14460 [Candidatus Dormibacteraeota bacterium]|nr:hypothetical protein [Candidatus Dormibacteraeota bacterium]